MTNAKLSYPNAEDLMKFLEAHMLGVDGSGHHLRREIFWSSEQVEKAIKAYFESMPAPIDVSAIVNFDGFGQYDKGAIDERVAAELGRQIMAQKNLCTVQTKNAHIGDFLDRTYSLRVGVKILPPRK